MFIGTNDDAHKAATQKLMEAAVHLRRASDALMAVQGVTSEPGRRSIQSDRTVIDTLAVRYDVLFQETAQRYFA